MHLLRIRLIFAPTDFATMSLFNPSVKTINLQQLAHRMACGKVHLSRLLETQQRSAVSGSGSDEDKTRPLEGKYTCNIAPSQN